jgi:pyruvate dehydrogenase E2 component (dihydrolipoamide acetyltransferase)
VRRLVQQQQETPQFHLDATVEADALLELLETVNDGREHRYSVTDVLLRAAALALLDVPHANVRWADGSRELLATTHIGLAVAAEGDLLVPVLRDVADKSLHAVRTARVDATRAARSRALGPTQQGGGSLTVSNLGMYKVDGVFPVLNPPEAMIVGVGRVRRPSGGGPALLKLVVGADHRVLNGAAVAEYLGRLVEFVERPVDALL